jgi:hypothetical protein
VVSGQCAMEGTSLVIWSTPATLESEAPWPSTWIGLDDVWKWTTDEKAFARV